MKKGKLDFYENGLIKEALNEYYDTFQHTLDTADFVPDKFNERISKYIFKRMQQKFYQIEIYNLLHLEENGYKLGIFQKLKIYFSGLRPFYNQQKTKKRNEIVKEKAESEPKANE